MKSRIKATFLAVAAGLLGLTIGAIAGDDGQTAPPKEKASPVAAVTKAVKAAFPGATVRGIEREREHFPVMLYEVELAQDGREAEVLVTPDGQIVAVSTELREKKDVPKAVLATIRKLSRKGKVNEVEKTELRAVPKLVALDKPRTVYEIEFVRNGREIEVRIGANGKILDARADNDDGPDDDHDADDDDGDDDD